MQDIKELLEQKYLEYATEDFIDNDPIQIPYEFSKKEDIEISAFLTCTIAWGKRNIIIRNSKKMMSIMDNSPYDFIVNHTKKDLSKIYGFVHRTFDEYDLKFFITSLKNIYENYSGLENIFTKYQGDKNMKDAITKFREIFFSVDHQERVEKHISDPNKGSAAKRINMFLRWMIRNDLVDFGIWKNISPSKLSIPLDVHVGNVSRFLGMLYRKQNDWKAVNELDTNLRKLDSEDPVKYDFSLFCIGINRDITT